MQQQVSVVTVGVNNLVRSRHFYVDGFGWTPAFENEQIIFYQMNGFVFGTWLALALADDMRRPLSTPGAFALGHNVPTRKEVQATMTLSWWLVCIGSGLNMAPHLHICSANFLHCLLCGRANPFRQIRIRNLGAAICLEISILPEPIFAIRCTYICPCSRSEAFTELAILTSSASGRPAPAHRRVVRGHLSAEG